MKTKAELNALKAEAEALSNKLSELSEEELTEVTGGASSVLIRFGIAKPLHYQLTPAVDPAE